MENATQTTYASNTKVANVLKLASHCVYKCDDYGTIAIEK